MGTPVIGSPSLFREEKASVEDIPSSVTESVDEGTKRTAVTSPEAPDVKQRPHALATVTNQLPDKHRTLGLLMKRQPGATKPTTLDLDGPAASTMTSSSQPVAPLRAKDRKALAERERMREAAAADPMMLLSKHARVGL